jgi:hypothetical protein
MICRTCISVGPQQQQSVDLREKPDGEEAPRTDRQNTGEKGDVCVWV